MYAIRSYYERMPRLQLKKVAISQGFRLCFANDIGVITSYSIHYTKLYEARVLGLDLSEANRIAKMVPEAPKMDFKKAFAEEPALLKEKDSSNPLIAKTMRLAEILEGSVRQTGIHACGILIGKNPLDENIP